MGFAGDRAVGITYVGGRRVTDADASETILCGGAGPDDPALADGHYYLPTVLDDCSQDRRSSTPNRSGRR